MLVILEGLDNTGKTTIAKMLMQYYKIQGKNAILAKELSTPVGEQIKQLSREGKLTPELKSYLFPADRRLLLDGLGKIKKDDIVIFDRYVRRQLLHIEWRMELTRNGFKELTKTFLDMI